MKTLLTALVLSLTPALALAEGCNWGTPKQTTASQCEAGQVWDVTVQGCVSSTTS